MMHRVVERLELQIAHEVATAIKSLEKESLHSLDNPQGLDPTRIRGR
jgi:hypothetical protein